MTRRLESHTWGNTADVRPRRYRARRGNGHIGRSQTPLLPEHLATVVHHRSSKTARPSLLEG